MDSWIVIAIIFIGAVLISLGIFAVMTLFEMRKMNQDKDPAASVNDENSV